ncbi:MAG: WbqC family protein [Cytophagales bacterium]
MNKDFIILPSYLLPPKSYFDQINVAKRLIINDLEVYKKQSLRNHFDILTSQGPLMITYPVCKPWRGKAIRNIEIDKTQKWLKNHWRSIKTAYGKAPFFEYYSDYFEVLIKNPPLSLLEYNQQHLSLCLKILGINKEILLLSEERTNLSNTSHFESELERFKNWDVYFSQQQDELAYQQQFGNDFVAGLSIIDLIFNQGPESVLYLKNS